MAGSSTSYDSYNGRQEHMETCAAQIQKQISLEATKEKIYTVYGNVINIIEELEDRIQKQHGRRSLPKSSTDYYDHSEKCDETEDGVDSLFLKLLVHIVNWKVEEIVQAQLLAFQVILKGCHPRVKEDMKDELEVKTKHWADVRQQNRIPRDIVDTYADRLMAIITKGKTTHSRELLDSKSESYSSLVKDDVQNVLNSIGKASEVDAKFHKDTTLKAKRPVIRAVVNNDAHFISITGYKGVLLALANDGQLLSFKYEKEDQKWNVHLNQTGLISFTHIYEIPRGQQVLAIDVSGKLYHSDGNLEKWTPVNEEGGAISKLIIYRKAVIAINEQKKFWKMDRNDPLKWNKKDYLKVWAVDTVGNVYFRESDSQPSWKTVKDDPKVQMMATIDQGVIGLDMTNVLWHRPNYQGNWDRWGCLSDIVAPLQDMDNI